jgi:hypothetical protein
MDPLNVQEKKRKLIWNIFYFLFFLKYLVNLSVMGSTKPHLSKAMLHNSQPKKGS